jgi:hypothetical protein
MGGGDSEACRPFPPDLRYAIPSFEPSSLSGMNDLAPSFTPHDQGRLTGDAARAAVSKP